MDETRQTKITPVTGPQPEDVEVELAPAHGRAGFLRQIIDHLKEPRRPPVKSADTGVAKAVGDYWDHARRQLGLRQ